ncbi:MAG: hypothetical protein V3R66_04880 [Rhodospirillales bacterium]
MRVLLSEVTILSKTKVCIAGWCEEERRIIRPLQATGVHWPAGLARGNLLAVGNILEFQPTGVPHNRKPPHNHEDTRMSRIPTLVNGLSPTETRNQLQGSVHESVEELF